MPPSFVSSASPPLEEALETVGSLTEELTAFRRDLHAHPELAWNEQRTTAAVAERLESEGLTVQRLSPTGLVVDVGQGPGPVLLRADLDALPIPDLTTGPWTSTVAGVAHACGHDLHTTALMGAAVTLARLQRRQALQHRVRLVFQPAEEVMPGGALEMVRAGVLDDVTSAFALHCDPTVEVGKVGLREGPVTGAADAVTVRLRGRGGHTSRPHLTQDLGYALATVVTDLPAVLSRRFDPRAGASVVWGEIRAGSALNVIPTEGVARGTVRMLDADAWATAEQLVSAAVQDLARPYGAQVEVDYVRGVPPVVNHPAVTNALYEAVVAALGSGAVTSTEQSLGGEDFGWYADRVPAAMGRLGIHRLDSAPQDLHQGDLAPDEQALVHGARVLVAAALSPPQVTGRYRSGEEPG